MRLAIHDGSVVVNVTMIEPDELTIREVTHDRYDPETGGLVIESVQIPAWTPGGGLIAVEHETAQIGWTVSKKGQLQEPPAAAAVIVVPASVTLAQARVALRRAGLFDQVEAAVKAAGGETLDAWEYSNTVSRHGSLVTTLGSQLGLTGEQIDALLIAANEIAF